MSKPSLVRKDTPISPISRPRSSTGGNGKENADSGYSWKSPVLPHIPSKLENHESTPATLTSPVKSSRLDAEKNRTETIANGGSKANHTDAGNTWQVQSRRGKRSQAEEQTDISSLEESMDGAFLAPSPETDHRELPKATNEKRVDTPIHSVVALANATEPNRNSTLLGSPLIDRLAKKVLFRSSETVDNAMSSQNNAKHTESSNSHEKLPTMNGKKGKKPSLAKMTEAERENGAYEKAEIEAKDRILYQQIQQAFLITSAQMLGLLALFLIYLNFMMMRSYIVPFFWAVTVSVLLRKPKQRMIEFLNGLRDIEIDEEKTIKREMEIESAKKIELQQRENQKVLSPKLKKRKHIIPTQNAKVYPTLGLSSYSNGSNSASSGRDGRDDKEERAKSAYIPRYFRIYVAKALFFWNRMVFPKDALKENGYTVSVLMLFVPVAAAAYFGYQYVVPSLVFIPIFISLFVILLLIVLPSSWHPTFVSVALITCLLITLIIITHFFSTRVIVEGMSLVRDINSFAEKVIHDPVYAATLENYGLTAPAVKEMVNRGREMIDEWMVSKGYNNITQVIDLVKTKGMDLKAQPSSYMEMVQSVIPKFSEWRMSDISIKFVDYVRSVDMSAITNIFRTIIGFFFGTGIGMLGLIGILSSSIFNIIAQTIVFLTSLYYLVQWDDFVLDKITKILPLHPDKQKKVTVKLQEGINRIFLCSLYMCFFHGIITWMIFKLFGLDFAYSASLMAGITAIFPFLSSWIVYIPAVAILYIQADENLWIYLSGIGCSQILLMWFVDPYIFTVIPNSHPYLTGISVMLGYSSFGVEGVILGPLLIVLTTTAYEIFQDGTTASSARKGKRAKRSQSFADLIGYFTAE